MQVDAEPRQAGDAERRVGDAELAILPARVRRQPGHDGFLDLHAVERTAVEAMHASVDADGGRRAGDEQQIAAAALGQHA